VTGPARATGGPPVAMRQQEDEVATSGIRRKIDDLGRVVIPAQLRRTLGLREGDTVEVTLEGERVVLSRPRDACVFCGREGDDLVGFRNRLVCRDCVHGLGGADGRVGATQGDPWAPLTTASRTTDPAPTRQPAPTPRHEPTHQATPTHQPTPTHQAAAAQQPAQDDAGSVPPELLTRRGVLDGDAWARASASQRDAQEREESPPDPPPASPPRPPEDGASTTAW
jgi:transcriptional pleiotropic regulator of transition state genes